MRITPAEAAAPALLELRQHDELHFSSVNNLDNGRGAIFGGQPLVQGLAAARRTVPGWPAHSLTGYFLRGGDPGQPVDYAVEAVRDGRRYASRRVLATQAGRPIYDMLCSFHDHEPGPSHQAQAPASPPPRSLVSSARFTAENAHLLPREMVEAHASGFPIELRLTNPETVFFERETVPGRTYWFRMASAEAALDPLDHQCLIAFMSDYYLAGTPASPHFPPSQAARAAVVTLNHSMWFHAPGRAHSWLMYHTDSPFAGQGRGLARGLIYDESGTLVATTAQEISIRAR